MVGGGIIGLEMATVYDALGSAVDVVELTDQLIPGCDPDLVKPLDKRIEERYESILLSIGVASVEASDDGSPGRASRARTRRSRRPTTASWSRSGGGRTATRSTSTRRAWTSTSAARSPSTSSGARTSPHIFAIGDIAGAPMLAHKASHEGVVAAEVIAGKNVVFDRWRSRRSPTPTPRSPGPGLTETEAVALGHGLREGVFPWQASGRALVAGPPGGSDQAPDRSRVPARARRRDRRPQRRRADRRGDARDRDGRRRRGPRAHDPRPPDPLGDA